MYPLCRHTVDSVLFSLYLLAFETGLVFESRLALFSFVGMPEDLGRSGFFVQILSIWCIIILMKSLTEEGEGAHETKTFYIDVSLGYQWI